MTIYLIKYRYLLFCCQQNSVHHHDALASNLITILNPDSCGKMCQITTGSIIKPSGISAGLVEPAGEKTDTETLESYPENNPEIQETQPNEPIGKSGKREILL